MDQNSLKNIQMNMKYSIGVATIFFGGGGGTLFQNFSKKFSKDIQKLSKNFQNILKLFQKIFTKFKKNIFLKLKIANKD